MVRIYDHNHNMFSSYIDAFLAISTNVFALLWNVRQLQGWCVTFSCCILCVQQSIERSIIRGVMMLQNCNVKILYFIFSSYEVTQLRRSPEFRQRSWSIVYQSDRGSRRGRREQLCWHRGRIYRLDDIPDNCIARALERGQSGIRVEGSTYAKYQLSMAI